MNIDQFRKRFADDSACRHFFESIAFWDKEETAVVGETPMYRSN